MSGPALWLSRVPMSVISLIAKGHGIEPGLLAAIVWKESSGEIYAQRFEPHYRWFYEPEMMAKVVRSTLETERQGQAFSYGLTQVMGAVAREHGFRGWFGELYEPRLNLEIGAKHLKRFYDRHKDWIKAIASYNAGSPRYRTDGKFENEAYVTDVLRYWTEAKNGERQ